MPWCRGLTQTLLALGQSANGLLFLNRTVVEVLQNIRLGIPFFIISLEQTFNYGRDYATSCATDTQRKYLMFIFFYSLWFMIKGKYVIYHGDCYSKRMIT